MSVSSMPTDFSDTRCQGDPVGRTAGQDEILHGESWQGTVKGLKKPKDE